MKCTVPLTITLAALFFLTACQLVINDQPEVIVVPTDTATVAIAILESPTEEVDIIATETAIPATPVPSETSSTTPTETQLASETPTPEFTPTDEIPATPDPNEGLGGIYFDESFNGSSGWGWTYVEEGIVRFGLESGGVLAVFEEANQGWRISLGPDTLTIGDQRVQITARAEVCGDLDEWGLLFRGTFTEENRFNGYLFKMSCSGLVRLEKLEDNQSSILLDWVSAEGIKNGPGSENTLMVWVVKDEFRLYVNETFVASVVDSTYDSGQYGIFGQDRTNGDAQFLFLAMRVYEVMVE